MKKSWIISLSVCLSLTCYASAATWQLDNGLAVSAPFDTNSNIIQLEFGCGDPYHLAVFPSHGTVLQKNGSGDTEYFYEPGRIQALVDGVAFPLVAAGSSDTVVLFGEGTAEENFLSDLSEEFIAALRAGQELNLRFDITPDRASDQSPFETYARFSLIGLDAILEPSLDDCVF